MKNAKSRQISTTFLLIFVYFIVAASSFNGYFTKWAFRDTDLRSSIDLMFDGTAHRPFVYRQLIPQIANFLDKEIPPSIKENIANISKTLNDDCTNYGYRQCPFDTYISARIESIKPKYMFRYSIVYVLTFASLLTSMFLLREICIEVSKSNIAGTLAPISFALILPLIFTRGGYFYDFFELMFMSTAFLLALRKRVFWIIPITLVATLNKESFPLFIFALIPLVQPFISRFKLLVFISSNVVIAAIVNLIGKSTYANNPGGNVEYQLVDNIKFYLHPLKYLFSFEWTYGMYLPKGFSIFILLTLFIIILKAWPSLERTIKQHTLFALAITIPLFMLFCTKDELRNLSMLYVAFTIMIAVYLKDILDRNVEMQGSPGFVVEDNQGKRDDRDPSPEGTKYRFK
jgi:hypothetical protein